MTKQEIIKRVQESTADEALKKMVISYINLGYDQGFENGMKRAGEMQLATLELINPTKAKP